MKSLLLNLIFIALFTDTFIIAQNQSKGNDMTPPIAEKKTK